MCLMWGIIWGIGDIERKISAFGQVPPKKLYANTSKHSTISPAGMNPARRIL